MNFTPLPAYLLHKDDQPSTDNPPRSEASGQPHSSALTKALVGVVLVLFIVLGSFTFLLFQAPKENSRASEFPPTPPFTIPTIFIVPSQSVTPETTPSGMVQK